MAAIENSSHINYSERHVRLDELNPFHKAIILLLNLLQGFQKGDIVYNTITKEEREISKVYTAGAFDLVEFGGDSAQSENKKLTPAHQLKLVAKRRKF